MKIALYHLVMNETVMYVGLTSAKRLWKRRSDHRRNRKEHDFVVMEIHENVEPAIASEIEHIERHNTYRDFSKWNKTPGGDYDGRAGYSRAGVGGQKKGSVPWNKGLTASDERVASNTLKAAQAKRESGFYDDCAKYLPKLTGDKNPMRNPEIVKKISARITGRKLVKEPSGNYWLYPDGSRSKPKLRLHIPSPC